METREVFGIKVPDDIISLRKCEGYDPATDLYLQEFPAKSENDQPVKQLCLSVKHRVRWFLQWCEEHGKIGVIDDSEVQLIGQNLVTVKASVYVDGTLIGKSISGGCLTGNQTEDTRLIQTIATNAKGRALANAGFNTAMHGTISEDGDPFPCDAGIQVTVGSHNFAADPENPMSITEVPKPRTRATAPKAAGMTLDDAWNVVVTSGVHAGKTLSQVAATDFKSVVWMADNVRNAQIKEAATLIVKNRQNG